jgi:hypothetical protein
MDLLSCGDQEAADEGGIPIKKSFPFPASGMMPRMISYAAGTTGMYECGDTLGRVKNGVETG